MINTINYQYRNRVKTGEMKSLEEKYSDVVYAVSDLYSHSELQRIMESNTRAAFKEVNLDVDKHVIYFRLFIYLLLNGVGAYTTFFVHVEKTKFLMKIMLSIFFSVVFVYTLYDKVLLKRSHFIVKLKNCKVFIWSDVNKKDGTFEIKYKRSGFKTKKEVYSIPLGELFFINGQCDYNHFLKLVQKLKPKIVALDSKDKKRD
ncbi:conserved hypothetical protein [Theileria orientalis strain Shintoku]|uniref:Signal peptidase complex subunit 2 n=1 Tax=Theileria orientalis strain Shintoku TaxID=869250 RepID=J4DPJ6_THEOR|nr:conserved hypothetical protein [Theileria orientalis strain Shintoku]BAM40819.1 conserved hypothetical protein [Theileria orientalis strain Shintoku]|eukprot:XP_009691120.1 conserved hypothetical protein [Theileria orientalis strain Shintoku]